MNAELRVQESYEAPRIDQRDAIDTPLVGQGSTVPCAAFTHQ